MKWRGRRTSQNVEDRRGMKRGPALGGGVILVVIVLSLITGQNPLSLLEQLGGAQTSQAPSAGGGQGPATSRESDELAQFVSVVLADTEAVWNDEFGGRYPEPTLVLFEDSVRSACGLSSSATGPFYCPGDNKLYLDLTFFRQLKQLGAPGDFALAYVIGHEVGHHVQTVTGISQKVRQAQAAVGKTEANQWQVRMELQADCYAGLWAHHAQRKFQILERGDIEEGLKAAAAIGDDSLQRRAGQQVRPEAFTHGTSAQRVQWFRTGFETGSVSACDTFG